MKTTRNTGGKAEKGSQKWIQKLINEKTVTINSLLKKDLSLPQVEKIEWLSPLATDNYTEYYDKN